MWRKRSDYTVFDYHLLSPTLVLQRLRRVLIWTSISILYAVPFNVFQ